MNPQRWLLWFTALTLLAGGAAWRGYAPVPVRVAAADSADDEQLRALLQARYATASRLLDLEEQRLQQSVTTLGRVCEVARWVRDSVVELPVSSQERIAALAKFVGIAQRLEEGVGRAVERGAAAEVDRETARYLRLDAEIALLRARGTPDPRK